VVLILTSVNQSTVQQLKKFSKGTTRYKFDFKRHNESFAIPLTVRLLSTHDIFLKEYLKISAS